MPPTHRKLRRKELKQPDEFLSFFEQAQEFITQNLTQVIVSVAIVGAVGLIALGTYYYERHLDHLTAAQFSSAFQALNAKQYKVAEAGFLRLASDEPGRDLGRLARFYLATCYLAENDLPRARDSLVAYLAEAHNSGFEGLALNDLAIVYERMGDLKKAEGAYRQAASIPGAQGARAELGGARVLAELGDRQGSIEAYRSFLAEHPFARERQDAVEALAQLGAAPEAAAGQSAAAIPPKVSLP